MTEVAWGWVGLGAVLACLSYAALLAARVVRAEGGSEVMRDILELIHAGAFAFAKSQYALLVRVSLVTATVLAVLGLAFRTGMGWKVALAYLAGVILAGLAGHLGMLISTRANARTTNLAAQSREAAFRIAFEASTVMGLAAVGVILVGLCGSWLILRDPGVIGGLALGVSTFGLFARVGGGIFAEATDVGSELALRLEGGIPEYDLQNPGVIADEIGDNVGGVTGLGADVAESVAGATVAAMTLGLVVTGGQVTSPFILLPLLLGAAGLVGSLGGQLVVSRFPGGGGRTAFWLGLSLTGLVVLASVFALCATYLPGPGDTWSRYLGFFWAGVVGWGAGASVVWLGWSTVSPSRSPARLVAEAAREGPALDLIRGLALGMRSVALPSLILAAVTGVSYYLGHLTQATGGGWYAVSLAILSLLSSAAFAVSMGAYGPIADNAHGIAKMADAPPAVLNRTQELDGLGKSGAAAARGYAGAAAALTSIILIVAYFEAYRSEIGQAAARELPRFDLLENPALMIGLLLGGLLPYLFSFFTLSDVVRVASSVMAEVRRQFRDIPGLRGGSARPDLATCVSIAIVQAHKGMAYTAVVALAVPTVVGLIDPMALGGVLVGATLSGFFLSTMLITAGGVWDAARRLLLSHAWPWSESAPEQPAEEEEVMDRLAVAHLLGDPLKESSGPAIHSLIKLMSITALVLAPVFASLHS